MPKKIFVDFQGVEKKDVLHQLGFEKGYFDIISYFFILDLYTIYFNFPCLEVLLNSIS